MPSDVTPPSQVRPAWGTTPALGRAEALQQSERRRVIVFYAALGLQAVCALVFLGELWSEVLGLRSTPIPYAWQEAIQVLASIGMVIGLAASLILVRRGSERLSEMNRQIDVASGNYETHLEDLFRDWGLSPSERSVTIYAMKGFSNAEIAEFRNTTAATVKSQMNAIYRKTGLSNRQQLISYLVEDLLAGVAVDRIDAARG